MKGSMAFGAIYGAVWLVVLVMATWRLKRRRLGLGSAATGIVDEMLNEDRRHAIEIIVEEKAAARDPEDADGNLPDLANGPRNRS